MREQTKKELVRLLVLQHGLQKASELSGVPYDLVRQWESRRKRKELAVTSVTRHPVTVAADNVAKEIAQNGQDTKLSLSRSAKRMAKDAEQATLRESRHVKEVAQTAALVHPDQFGEQDKGSTNVLVNIALLGVSQSEA